MNFISSYCYIKNDSVSCDGIPFLTGANSINDLVKTAYKKLNLDYPKIYKMDMLSKTAFIGVEILKSQYPEISKYKDDEIALIFSNKNSSADTDIKFIRSYQQDAVPSPALFVYTLPNIMIGEIAIRNKWYGENLFVIHPRFDSAFFSTYGDILLSEKAKACICGWVNVLEENIECMLFFVEKTDTKKLNLSFTPETIKNIYNTNHYENSKGRIEKANY
jgi:hypothetical protein